MDEDKDKNQKLAQHKSPSKDSINDQKTIIKANSGDSNLNAEEIAIQLKEKLKQNKVLQTKNSKLQTKYVQLFRQHKTLKQDNQAFVEFIKWAFEELSNKAPGSYQVEQMKSALNKRQNELNDKIKELVESNKKEKKMIEIKMMQEMEEKLKNVELQHRNSSEANVKELQSYKRNNKVLNDQILDFQKKLTLKNDQISKISKEKLKLEHQVNSYKIKEIKEEIGESVQEKQEKANKQRNQMLKLTHQIDSLMEKRDELRKQLKDAKTKIQSMKQSNQKQQSLCHELKKKNKDLEAQIQEMKYQKEEKQSKEPPKLIQIKNSSESEPEEKMKNKKQLSLENEDFLGDSDYVHRQYMKNVFLRYMKCLKDNDLVHSQILLNVIITILKFNSEEKELANSKKKGWWGLY